MSFGLRWLFPITACVIAPYPAQGFDPNCIGTTIQLVAGDHEHLDTLLFQLYQRGSERESAVVAKFWIYDGMSDETLCKKLSLSPAELQEAKKLASKRLFQLEPTPAKQNLARAQAGVLIKLHREGKPATAFRKVKIISYVPAEVGRKRLSLAARVAVEEKIELLENAAEPRRTQGLILRGLLLESKPDLELRAELGMSEIEYARAKRDAKARFGVTISKFPDAARELSEIFDYPGKANRALNTHAAPGDQGQTLLDRLVSKLYKSTKERESAVVLKYWLYDGLDDATLRRKLALDEPELQEAKQAALARLLQLEPNAKKKALLRAQTERLVQGLSQKDRESNPTHDPEFIRDVPATIAGQKFPLSDRILVETKIELLENVGVESTRTIGKILRGWLLESKSDSQLARDLAMSEPDFIEAKLRAKNHFFHMFSKYPELSALVGEKGRASDSAAEILAASIKSLKGSKEVENQSCGEFLEAWLLERRSDERLQTEFNLDASALELRKTETWRNLKKSVNPRARIKILEAYPRIIAERESTGALLNLAIEKLTRSELGNENLYAKFLESWLVQRKSDEVLEKEYGLNARDLKELKAASARALETGLEGESRKKIFAEYGWAFDQAYRVRK